MQRWGLQRKTSIAAAALACVLLASGRVRAQGPGGNPLHTASREELEVVKVALAQENAWNSGDLEGWAKQFKNSPDTLFIGREVMHGYTQIEEDYRHNYPSHSSMGTLTYSELEVHTLDETAAVCIGKYHIDRPKKDGGAAEGLFSLVLQKTADGWKIVLDHTT